MAGRAVEPPDGDARTSAVVICSAAVVDGNDAVVDGGDVVTTGAGACGSEDGGTEAGGGGPDITDIRLIGTRGWFLIDRRL